MGRQGRGSKKKQPKLNTGLSGSSDPTFRRSYWNLIRKNQSLIF